MLRKKGRSERVANVEYLLIAKMTMCYTFSSFFFSLSLYPFVTTSRNALKVCSVFFSSSSFYRSYSILVFILLLLSIDSEALFSLCLPIFYTNETIRRLLRKEIKEERDNDYELNDMLYFYIQSINLEKIL